MDEQKELFPSPETLGIEDTPVYEIYNNHATHASVVAAQKIAPKLKGIKQKIVDLLEAHPEGLTIFDMEELTGSPLRTVSGRPGELLRQEHPPIFKAGETTSTFGRKLTVYKHIKYKEQ